MNCIVMISLAFRSRTAEKHFYFGGSDYVSLREDHDIVSNAVNYYYPGHSGFITIKNADHGMQPAKDFTESKSASGPYNPEVRNVIGKWLDAQL